MTLPKVVIVGGGPGGLSVAKGLQKVADVTIIEKKGFHEINWASLRVITDPAFAKQVLHPYNAIPGIGTVVQAEVTFVSTSSVSLSSGDILPFDYLVLAPGSSYPDPAVKTLSGSLGERKSALLAEHKRLQAAESVVIVGGGPVGVELAAEILVDLPGKEVTLVTSSERLIADKNPKIGAECRVFLEKKGAKVITGQKATKQGDSSVKLTDGTLLHADVVYYTLGGRPNTAFLGTLGVTDEQGFIQVNSNLQLQGFPNIFAVGDAVNVKETKMGFYAGQHGALVAKNIQATIAGKPLKAWKPFGGFTAMIISLGRNWGTGHLGPVNMTGCFGYVPAKLKSKDLLTGKTQHELGIQVA